MRKSLIGAAFGQIFCLAGCRDTQSTPADIAPKQNQPATPTSQPAPPSPAAKPYAKKKQETRIMDSVGGCEHMVLSEVLLSAREDRRLDMMASTVLKYSYIPRHIATALGAAPVGELELKAGSTHEQPHVDEPEHLRAIYCMNKTGQRRFQVVRIERFDLGVGPAFGPVEALVLDDANSAIGVIGRDWLYQQHEGMTFILSAGDDTVYFGALRTSRP